MSEERKNMAFADHLFLGGWKTSNEQKLTAITAKPLELSKVFRISCTELIDADVVQFRFYVDGKTIIAPLNEGGSVFIQGKSIFIEQIEEGINFLAKWEVVQETPLAFEKAIWVVYPQEGIQSLVAAFEEEQDFVLSINLKSNGCSDGRMVVVIDGQEVKDNKGNVIQFLEGSSVIGKGKIVSVVVTGTCSPKNKFYGDIKIHKGINK